MSFVVEAFSSNFEKEFIGKKWILDYYNEIVFFQDRTLLLNHIPKYRNQEDVLFQRDSILDECEYWNDELSEADIVYLLFDAFEVDNIKEIEKGYYELSLCSKIIDDERYKENLENGCDWGQSNIEIKTLYFKFDGDYLYISLNYEDNLLATYCAYENNEYKYLVKFIQTGTSDLSNVSLPRHADGSCDYEKGNTSVASSSSATNVSINKTMSVKENLKLRSAEATSSNVLTVMSAGTKVKVLEVGKEETIDGIKSNWVKVEVISGRDRDGKDIKKKTTGWCYGGYLE